MTILKKITGQLQDEIKPTRSFMFTQQHVIFINLLDVIIRNTEKQRHNLHCCGLLIGADRSDQCFSFPPRAERGSTSGETTAADTSTILFSTKHSSFLLFSVQKTSLGVNECQQKTH